MGIGGRIVRGELRRLRLARLKEAILALTKQIVKQAVSEDRLHPGYLGLGRLVYEASTRDFKPTEIPKPLRACPWLHVLALLAKQYPEVQWCEAALAGYVKIYLAAQADGTLLKPDEQPALLDFKGADEKAWGFVEGA